VQIAQTNAWQYAWAAVAPGLRSSSALPEVAALVKQVRCALARAPLLPELIPGMPEALEHLRRDPNWWLRADDSKSIQVK
jgi:hypothetical protein